MVGFKRKPKSPSVATPWSLVLVISSSFAWDGELLQIYVVPCCRVPLGSASCAHCSRHAWYWREVLGLPMDGICRVLWTKTAHAYTVAPKLVLRSINMDINDLASRLAATILNAFLDDYMSWTGRQALCLLIL